MRNTKRLSSMLATAWLATASLAQTASFSTSKSSGCSPLMVDFKNSSSGASTYRWDLGNGNASTAKDPSAVYNSPGTYKVTLVAVSSTGQEDKYETTLTVFASPKAALTSDRNGVCEGGTVSFSDASTYPDGAAQTRSWDFGDGGTSTDAKPVYTYSLPGTYSVTLAVTDANGCTDARKVTSMVVVNPRPTGHVQPDRTYRCDAPATFNMTVNNTNGTQFSWDFGDGSSAYGQSVKHVYGQGTHLATVFITGSNGCTSKATHDLHVVRPNVWYSSPNACDGEPIKLVNQTAPDDGTGSYQWSYGQWSSSDKNPEITLPEGTHKIKLTFNWDGCSLSYDRDVVVRKTSGRITPGDTLVCAGKGKLSLSASGSWYASVEWKLGGQPHGPTLKRDTAQGTYEFVARFRSDIGCPDGYDTARIRLSGPTAMFSATPTKGCVPYPIRAEDASYGPSPIKQKTWFWSGGADGSGDTFAFTNSRFGKSGLQLFVTDEDGCTDLSTLELGAGIRPTAVFSVIPDTACSNERLKTYNGSTPTSPDTVSFTWQWQVGERTGPEGEIYPGTDTVHLMFRSPPGNAKLTLTATSFGCTDTASDWMQVQGPFLAWSSGMDCATGKARMENLTQGYTGTHWYVGGAEVRDSIIHVWPMVKVPLVAWNDTSGCRDSVTVSVPADTQEFDFTATRDCKTGTLKLVSDYENLPNAGRQTWTLASDRDTITVSGDSVYVEPSEGTYLVTLTVNNPDYYCPAGTSRQIKIPGDGKAKASVSRTTCFPVDVALSAPVDGWASSGWTVGDTVVQAHVKNIRYSGLGDSLSVVFNAVDSFGCSRSDSFGFSVESRARIVGHQDNSACSDPAVRLYAYAEPARPVMWTWELGGRTSTSWTDTARLLPGDTSTFFLAGTDSSGCVLRSSWTGTTYDPRPRAGIVSPDTTVDCPPLSLLFVDSSGSGPNLPIVKRLWTFGDGSQSLKVDPAKIYTMPGEYVVSLVVTNSAGCTDTAEATGLIVVRGPKGKYVMDRTTGCEPLTVVADVNMWDASAFSLDLGDGTVVSGRTTHTYSDEGTYTPRLVLFDSSGCAYSPQTPESVVVWHTPVAILSAPKLCEGVPLQHRDSSVGALSRRWTVAGKTESTVDSVTLNLPSGLWPVRVTVTTNMGCSDSAEVPVRSYGIRTTASPERVRYCLGDTIQVLGGIDSDTSIVGSWMRIGSNTTEPWDHVASERGALDITMTSVDALGCRDTLFLPKFVLVGDTARPDRISVVRSTVTGDYGTETLFGSSDEVDFDGYDARVGGFYWSSADRRDTSFASTGLNTLDNAYGHYVRQVNYCGVWSEPYPHVTVNVDAVSDTNAINVSWTGYSGWDVDAYELSRSRDGGPYELLAVVRDSSYSDSALWCRSSYRYRVTAIGSSWSKSDTAGGRAILKYDVPAPEVWTVTVDGGPLATIATRTPARFPISGYDLYRDGFWVADLGPGWSDFADVADVTSRHVYWAVSTDVCGNTSARSNPGNNIVLTVEADGPDAVLGWTPYEGWPEGVAWYSLERSTSGGPFAHFASTSDTSWTDSEMDRECQTSYEYRVVAHRAKPADTSCDVTSVSNVDGFHPEPYVHIPDAFTPDGNDLNEAFAPVAAYCTAVRLRVYGSNGQKLFDQTGCRPRWDGAYMGEPVQHGVYTYVLDVTSTSGSVLQFSGTLTLLR